MAAALSEEILAHGRGLIERLEIVGEVLTEALREQNRKIKELQDAKSGDRERRQQVVQHILLRKILSVDRGDSGKLLRGIKALMESVVTIALSVRADTCSERQQPSECGDPTTEGTNAFTALKLVGGQLDMADQRLGKIELRAGQLQLIGGPQLDGELSDESDDTDGGSNSLANDSKGDSADNNAVASDAAALASLADQPGRGMEQGRLLLLGAMVAEMRVLESSVEFHTALLSAHRKLAAEGNNKGGIPTMTDEPQRQRLQYSRTNFSYGSTPHSSWLALFDQCAPLRAAVDDMLGIRGAVDSQRSLDEYCVFGSSLGWLCFYGCLTFGLRCTGYEIVQPLVALSKRLAERHGIGGGGCGDGHAQKYAESVTFHHMDMLDADLQRVRILVLTSHVWDAPLLERLDVKLAQEVPPVLV